MRGLALAVFCALAPLAATAQGLSLGTPVPDLAQSQILVIDFEKVYAQSGFGRRATAALEAEREAITAENRSIEAELVEEEGRLTDMRATMQPMEFRQLAETFDAKVQRLRREQDEKARALGSRNDALRRQFVEAARPVLASLMQQAGAAVILERRSVFVAADAIDVTDEAIARIDASLGDGATLPPPEQSTVER